MIMSVKAWKPHVSIGQIAFVMDVLIVLMGSFIFRDVEGIIYGLIVTYLLSAVVDKVMYGIDAGKMTLIVTDYPHEIAAKIDEYTGRGATFLRGRGSYSKEEKEIVMCACNNKQMYTIRKMAKEIDPKAFIVIMELIVTYLLSAVVDKVMYGIDAGKMTLIVTDYPHEIAAKIDEYTGRGSTFLRGRGSYSKEEKEIVMCACNNKQMYTIRKMAKEIDPKAFIVIMESNDVVGEGFKEN